MVQQYKYFRDKTSPGRPQRKARTGRGWQFKWKEKSNQGRLRKWGQGGRELKRPPFWKFLGPMGMLALVVRGKPARND